MNRDPRARGPIGGADSWRACPRCRDGDHEACHGRDRCSCGCWLVDLIWPVERELTEALHLPAGHHVVMDLTPIDPFL